MIRETFHGWLLVVLCAGAIFFGGPAAYADATQWKAGVGVVKITPPKAVVMAGYASRVRPFERVEQEIFAKALAVEDSQGRRGVVVTMDLIGLSASVAEPVCRVIGEKWGLSRGQILLSFAHNHAGPQVAVGPRGEGEAGPSKETVEYTQWLEDRLVEVVGKALEGMGPARLSWGTGVANFVMNRREFTEKGVILGVNARGPADRTVPVLRVADEGGKVRAVVFGCACHNTTLGANNYAIVGDYAGFAQAHVEERLPGTVAMFMMGFGGDANPYPRDTMDAARRHGKELGEEVLRVLGAGKLKGVSGPLTTVMDHVELPLEKVSREELEVMATKGAGWRMASAKAMLAMMDKGKVLPASYRAPVGVWQFGKDLTLVAMPSEVVVDYVYGVEKAVGPLNLWLAAYCNDYFGYIPSARVIKEGGYETRGLFSGAGWFAAGVEGVLVGKVRELAGKAGRVGVE